MLTFKDKIRAMCHQLKMDSLLNVESSHLSDLRSRIAKLPSPEKIAGMSKDELEALGNRMEHLIYDLDKASVPRSKQRALRDISVKGLPPYRKPLLASKNWYSIYQNS